MNQNINAIKDAIAAIEAVLPFLITLTDDERKALFKAGPERLSFVQNAGQAAQDNPDILHKTFHGLRQTVNAEPANAVPFQAASTRFYGARTQRE